MTVPDPLREIADGAANLNKPVSYILELMAERMLEIQARIERLEQKVTEHDGSLNTRWPADDSLDIRWPADE